MISLDKKYTTLDGCEVKLIATDNPQPYCVIGALRCPDGTWVSSTWDIGGRFHQKSEGYRNLDLIEEAPRYKGTAYVDVFDGTGALVARARVPYDVKKGEGL